MNSGSATLAQESAPRSRARAVEPTSYSQRRLWLLDQILPQGAVYNTPQVLRLSGTLDRVALQLALDELARRQASLRTAFASRDGEPVQFISDDCTIPLVIQDLRGASVAALRQAAEEEIRRPFDLARAPLVRARLLQSGDREHWLVLTLHHIITDGWSGGVMRRELGLLYGAFAEGRPSPLPELPLQYADYARQQREWLQGDAVRDGLAYWRAMLADVPVLELPTDRPRPIAPTYRGRHLRFDLDPGLARRLHDLARRQHVTLFMLLVAAYEVLLHRLTGQTTIAVGFPIAGRRRSEFEGLIGFFVNTLVLRGDLTPDTRFRDVLTQVRDRALQAYRYQDVPFERIVEEIAPARDASRNPLFQACINLHNQPDVAWNLPGFVAEPVEAIDTGTAKFDLNLTIRPGGDTLCMRIEYPLDLFLPETIEGFARCWQTLLSAIVDDPDSRIDRLPLLSAAERDALIAVADDAVRAAPQGDLAGAFEACVARHPHAVALAEAGETITYAELDRQANRIARYLLDGGIQPGDRIALCLERSSAMVGAILGVLKAGGVYVPLDPGHPSDRIAAMLGDCAAAAVITLARFRDRLGGHRGVLCLDADSARLQAQSDAAPRRPATSAALACVMYTSGSTGEPKGVMVRQSSVLRLVLDQNYVRLGPEDVMAHVSNVAFDAASFEIWGALLHGARLAILPQVTVIEPEALAQAIAQEGITCMFLTTSLFNQVASCQPAAFGSMRHLLFGGEAADPRSVRAVMAAGAPAVLANMYGPTETTTFATFHRIEEDPGGSVPIGKPILGTAIVIVDRNDAPVPRGVVGEILVRGEGVAAGYLGRDDLTRERFVSDPSGERSGRLAYRTGDLGRWRHDGQLEFAGRIDDQLKIRGHRIEPGEVRAVLCAHPAVRAAHVMLRTQPSGDPGLTAYVAGDEVDPNELRAWLAEKLPGYMVPASFVPVAALPLASTGKIDTRALPAPRPEHGRVRSPAEPRDAIERGLRDAWQEVLGLENIGIDDDFFDLGGHSLMAARLFARMDERFGYRLPLASLFSTPTIRGLAEQLRAATPQTHARVLVAVQPHGSRRPLFLVPGVFGDVVGFAPLARALGSDQPLYALQSLGLGEGEAPLARIEDIAGLAAQEIRTLQPAGPYAIAGACFGATVAYEIARQLLAAGEEVALLGLLDPTTRGGTRGEWPMHMPRVVRRIATALAFGLGRLELYRADLRELPGAARRAYVAGKLRTMAGTLLSRRAMTPVAREVDRLEVYRANLTALDGYRRPPLPQPARVVALLLTQRQSAQRSARIEQAKAWGRQSLHVVLPGKDSGDMLSAVHAPAVASELQRALLMADDDGA